MRSSYIKNNYGRIFELIVRSYNVQTVVELGVLDGYSATHIAKGLFYNKVNLGVPGHLDAYDLWEDYPYKHGDREEVYRTICKSGLKDFVTLHKANAFEVYKGYEDKSIYLLHVDISNTGETVKRIMEQWNPKMVHNGVILFEGGSVERDNVDWMKKYNKPSIRKEINTNEIIDLFYIVATYDKFPSLTLLYKKYDEEHMP